MRSIAAKPTAKELNVMNSAATITPISSDGTSFLPGFGPNVLELY